MKTEVVMKRELLGYQIRQRHQSGYFYTSDLEVVANKVRLEHDLPMVSATAYFSLHSTRDFLKALAEELGQDPTEFIRGTGKGRYVHPYVFLDLAMWFNPNFKVKVYQWLFDNLLQVRDNSGDSYKAMAEAIINNFDLISRLPLVLSKIARKIRKACGLPILDQGVWETASKDQLFIRDKIQSTAITLAYISKSPEVMIDQAIRIVAEQYPGRVNYVASVPLRRIIKKK